MSGSHKASPWPETQQDSKRDLTFIRRTRISRVTTGSIKKGKKKKKVFGKDIKLSWLQGLN